jgi:hypothetical protein
VASSRRISLLVAVIWPLLVLSLPVGDTLFRLLCGGGGEVGAGEHHTTAAGRSPPPTSALRLNGPALSRSSAFTRGFATQRTCPSESTGRPFRSPQFKETS